MKYYYPPAWLTLFRTEEGKIEANKKKGYRSSAATSEGSCSISGY
ncbi:hypothetical protein A2U01_0049052, partial [Trifolium medium]|nr:hypothetical protein [Trifolium medium]